MPVLDLTFHICVVEGKFTFSKMFLVPFPLKILL